MLRSQIPRFGSFAPWMAACLCLLACSDGGWHYFSPTELASVVDSLSPREATEFLIEKARSRARGGGDNLSLVIVKIEALVEEKKIARLVPIDAGRA